MNNNTTLTQCECGSTTFIGKPDKYPVFTVNSNGVLEWQRDNLCNDTDTLTCEECGKEYSLEDFRAIE